MHDTYASDYVCINHTVYYLGMTYVYTQVRTYVQSTKQPLSFFKWKKSSAHKSINIVSCVVQQNYMFLKGCKAQPVFQFGPALRE